LYLAVVVAGLAAGLWPEATAAPKSARPSALLPSLQTVALAQVGFALLVQPLVALRRGERAAVRRYWPQTLLESAGLVLVTVPIYAAAAYFADAVAVDVVRTVICVVGVWTVGWAAGKHLACRRGGRGVLILMLLIVAVGMPAAYYIARQFLADADRLQWLWRVTPATLIWQAAAPRQACWLPRPLWALLVWPVLAAALILLDLLRPARREVQ
jgi:hypothetical protein